MKALQIFLIFLTILSAVICAVDYCEVETRLCEPNTKHIGCEKNIFPDTVYKLGKITNELKKIILDEINSFRSFVATGQQSEFESASNMRLVVNSIKLLNNLCFNKKNYFLNRLGTMRWNLFQVSW